MLGIAMHKQQRGITLTGVMMWSVILVFGAIVGMKLMPAYMEFAAIKKNLAAIANDQSVAATPAEIIKSFDKRAVIDDIKTIKGADLTLDKNGSEIIMNANYSVKTPIVANISLCIDFNASRKK